MAAREIADDLEYREWVLINPEGFVLNTGPNPAVGQATLHRADCMHIADHKTGKLAGSASRKFVAETKQEIREEAIRLGRPPGNRWNTCRTCGA